MAPRGALAFNFEQVFCNANPNYTDLYALIKKEEGPGATKPLSVGGRLLALKKGMAPKGYRQLRALAESAAEKAETQSLLEAPLLQGVDTAIEAGHAAGWLVAVVSDYGRVSVSKALEHRSLSKRVDLVAARTRIDEERLLSKRVSPVGRKVKGLSRVVYFCNRSREVKEAKSLGMRCIVLPSRSEPFRTLLWAEPDGMILSLEELPQLLALPSMKLPEPAPDERAGGQPAKVPDATPESESTVSGPK